MIIEFDHKKSTVTFGGERFVCLFVKSGLINKNFKISVFEADVNFQPLDLNNPLFVENVPFDDRKVLSALKIIGELDGGKATWIPNKYLSKDRNSKDVQDLEEKAAQMALGKARILLDRKDYFNAQLNIQASLFSKYLPEHAKYLE